MLSGILYDRKPVNIVCTPHWNFKKQDLFSRIVPPWCFSVRVTVQAYFLIMKKVNEFQCIFAAIMFLEPSFHTQRRGWIEVICGSMFSGKTEELIRRLRRARIADQSVEIFKPARDTRYSADEVVSHDARTIRSRPVMSSQEILYVPADVDVIGIDEAQFFDDEIANVCDELAFRGIRVIVAGLDMDYTGKPFGQMPFLMAKRVPYSS